MQHGFAPKGPFSITLKSPNVKQVSAEIAALGKSNAKAIYRRALREAANTAVRKLKEAAPVDTGATKKAIGQVEQTNKSYTRYFVYIGVRQSYEFKVTRMGALNALKKGSKIYGATSKKGKDIYVKRPHEYAFIAERRSKKHKNWFHDVYSQSGTRSTMVKTFIDQLRPQIQIQLQKIKAAAAKRAAA
jgi:hypothetical protein